MTPNRSNGYVRVNLRFTRRRQVCEQQPLPLKSYQAGRQNDNISLSVLGNRIHSAEAAAAREPQTLAREPPSSGKVFDIWETSDIFTIICRCPPADGLLVKIRSIRSRFVKTPSLPETSEHRKGRIGGEGGEKGGKRRAFNESAAPDSSCQRRTAVCRKPKTPQHASPRPL